MSHLDRGISAEIRKAVKELPLYQGGPGVDYSRAAVAYSVSVTLLHTPDSRVTPDAQALLVQRASGHGRIGSWSGVTGYIDVVRDPTGKMPDGRFDPIAYTVRNELEEECTLPPEVLGGMQLRLGERLELQSKYTGGTLHVMPVLAIYSGRTRPPVKVNPRELSGYAWLALKDIPTTTWVNRGYIRDTLPRILRVLP